MKTARVLPKRYMLVAMGLAVGIALVGCSSNSGAGQGDTSTSAEATIPDLTGTWKQSNPDSTDSFQQATITADTITIEWVSDAGSTTAIYWIGSFVPPTSATEPYNWTSVGDTAAMESQLLASQDSSKDFSYSDGTLSYKVTALGITKTVNLQRT